MSLREGAIEAVASKIECGPAGYCKFCAERAVDAILNYLEANADEWAEWGAVLEDEDDEPMIVPKGLVAALRIQENQP